MEDSPERRQIRDLQLEILRLQTKLKDIHASDSAADRRALTTLRQHVETLQLECQVSICIRILIMRLNPAALTGSCKHQIISLSSAIFPGHCRQYFWTGCGACES